jgi:hypothetical protein
VQVEEWVLTGFSRQVEEVGSHGRPRRLVGEVGDDLVGSRVERLHGLGSHELLGCDVGAVGVALDRVEEPGRWVELAQHGAGGDGSRRLTGPGCGLSWPGSLEPDESRRSSVIGKPREGEPATMPLADAEVAGARAALKPELTAVIGVAALVVIIWMTVAKPF